MCAVLSTFAFFASWGGNASQERELGQGQLLFCGHLFRGPLTGGGERVNQPSNALWISVLGEAQEQATGKLELSHASGCSLAFDIRGLA
jgi:hypothetical protein